MVYSNSNAQIALWLRRPPECPRPLAPTWWERVLRAPPNPPRPGFSRGGVRTHLCLKRPKGGALLLTALCRGQNHCPRRQHTNMTLKQEPPPGRAGTGVQQKHSHRCCHCRGPGADNEVAAPGCGRLEGRPERPLWVWRKAARFL